MAGAVHDATGRKCSVETCGKEFVKSAWTGRIVVREGAFIVHKIVCKECWHKHWEAGE